VKCLLGKDKGDTLTVSISALVLFFMALSVPPSHAASGIRSVDFLNFTYQPALCKEWLGKSVRVRNGQWNGKEAYYGVNKVIYGDLTGDGDEDAVIDISCRPKHANYTEGSSRWFRLFQAVGGPGSEGRLTSRLGLLLCSHAQSVEA
jgi:hypothetical protein